MLSSDSGQSALLAWLRKRFHTNGLQTPVLEVQTSRVRLFFSPVEVGISNVLDLGLRAGGVVYDSLRPGSDEVAVFTLSNKFHLLTSKLFRRVELKRFPRDLPGFVNAEFSNHWVIPPVVQI